MIVCKVCGTENEQGAAFCGSCGSFLEWSGEAVAPDEAPTTPIQTGPGPVPPVPATPSPAAPAPTGSAGEPVTGPGAAGAGEAGDGPMLICPACGTPNEPTRVFCRSCATELAPTTAPPPVPPVAPRSRSGPPVAVLGGLAAVVVLGVLAAVFLLPKGSPVGTATEAPRLSASPPGSAGPSASPAASGGAVTASPPVTSPSPAASSSPAASAPPLTGQIVFAADRNGNADLWIWDAATGKQHKLVGGAGSQWDPSWTGDGSAVVYRTANGFRMVNADGSPSAVPDFTHHGVDHDPAGSPDGSLIAFASTRRSKDQNIFTRPVADNSVLTQLTRNPASDSDPYYSADGTTIAFVSGRSGEARLYLMDADGSHQRPFDLGKGAFADPAFSPDGQWLAFTRRASAGAHAALYVVRVDGSGMRGITHVSVNEHDPTWSPDSRYIAVARGEKGSPIVIVDTVTGSDVVELGVDGATNKQPGWH